MHQSRHEPVYMISIAAKLCDVHVQTLRLYERLGLLTPARKNGKNRLFSQADIERVQQIQTLTQSMGVNLAGVEVIFRLREQMDKMREEMQEHLLRIHTEAVAEIERVIRQTNLPVVYKVPLSAGLSNDDPIDQTLREDKLRAKKG